jgi:hypothetical protein
VDDNVFPAALLHRARSICARTPFERYFQRVHQPAGAARCKPRCSSKPDFSIVTGALSGAGSERLGGGVTGAGVTGGAGRGVAGGGVAAGRELPRVSAADAVLPRTVLGEVSAAAPVRGWLAARWNVVSVWLWRRRRAWRRSHRQRPHLLARPEELTLFVFIGTPRLLAGQRSCHHQEQSQEQESGDGHARMLRRLARRIQATRQICGCASALDARSDALSWRLCDPFSSAGF